jgi:hypothetical protein
MCRDVSGCVGMCRDVSGCVGMCRDVSGCVGMCRDVSQCGGNEWCKLPLDQRVVFKTMLQKQNRLQVPKLVRWEYKLESSEVLRVTVTIVDVLGVREIF